MKTLVRVLAAALVPFTGPVCAQQTIGISVVGALSPSLGVHCGFDCNDPGNAGRVVGIVGQWVDVRLYGDAGLPAVVAIGLGPSLGTCPGLVIPGFGNSFQILPQDLLVSVGIAGLAPGSRACGAGGSSVVLPRLAILAPASGWTLTFQGLVFDQGVPSLTRPVEMPVR